MAAIFGSLIGALAVGLVWQFQAIKQADVRKAEEGGRRVAEEAPRKEAKAKYNLAEAAAAHTAEQHDSRWKAAVQEVRIREADARRRATELESRCKTEVECKKIAETETRRIAKEAARWTTHMEVRLEAAQEEARWVTDEYERLKVSRTVSEMEGNIRDLHHSIRTRGSACTRPQLSSRRATQKEKKADHADSDCMLRMHALSACSVCMLRLHAARACSTCMLRMHALHTCSVCFHRFQRISPSGQSQQMLALTTPSRGHPSGFSCCMARIDCRRVHGTQR